MHTQLSLADVSSLLHNLTLAGFPLIWKSGVSRDSLECAVTKVEMSVVISWHALIHRWEWRWKIVRVGQDVVVTSEVVGEYFCLEKSANLMFWIEFGLYLSINWLYGTEQTLFTK